MHCPSLFSPCHEGKIGNACRPKSRTRSYNKISEATQDRKKNQSKCNWKMIHESHHSTFIIYRYLKWRAHRTMMMHNKSILDIYGISITIQVKPNWTSGLKWFLLEKWTNGMVIVVVVVDDGGGGGSGIAKLQKAIFFAIAKTWATSTNENWISCRKQSSHSQSWVVQFWFRFMFHTVP